VAPALIIDASSDGSWPRAAAVIATIVAIQITTHDLALMVDLRTPS
jgi:hypothetical protein